MFSLCLGCAGKNTVAGADKTKAEQLEEAVPSWCERICDRLSTCAGGEECDCSGDVCTCNGGGVDCVSDCQHEMQRYTGGGDECATVGLRFSSCLDGLTCEQLGDKRSCRLSDAEERHCPHDDDDPPTGGVGSPSGTGGATGSAGSATGGIPPSGAAGMTSGGTGSGGASGGTGSGVSVSCDEGYGVGSAGTSAGGSPSSVTCEEGRQGCSDEHDYNWVCVEGSQGQLGCTCFVDSQVTGGFDPGRASCPSLPTVNAGCGWNIVE